MDKQIHIHIHMNDSEREIKCIKSENTPEIGSKDLNNRVVECRDKDVIIKGLESEIDTLEDEAKSIVDKFKHEIEVLKHKLFFRNDAIDRANNEIQSLKNDIAYYIDINHKLNNDLIAYRINELKLEREQEKEDDVKIEQQPIQNN